MKEAEVVVVYQHGVASDQVEEERVSEMKSRFRARIRR